MTGAVEHGLRSGALRCRAGTARIASLWWLGVAAVLLSVVLFRPAGAAEEPFYLIGPGDSLEIFVRNQPELSRSVVVRPDGRLTVPLVEDLVSSGLTPQELARVSEERLAV